MSASSGKSKRRRADKRYGHKQARQSTRHVLEDGAPTSIAHGVHWSPSIEQPPISDDAVVGTPKSRKQGCKRNKYEPHVIVPTEPQRTYNIRYNFELKQFERVEIPWYRRRYIAPYECKHCHKSFYRIPKRGAVRGEVVSRTPNEVISKADHYDTFNIKMRLLGLNCHCDECQNV